MDPATAIALCKENIQPLRHGRNAVQLGTALRAQEDAEAQQMLMQEKQMYEDAIKNYSGDDPLESWYEYILWTEQSYPKSGHESHIGKILQQCLAAFEKDPKYHQDRRYIRLWINYISMQKNPLELYQLLYNNGIGTMVADMYRAWAFELEQVEDCKRADEVYSMGIAAHAEPREELDFAHKNFQLSMGRRMLGRMDERSEIPLFEQRQAFSSLRAIKAGRRVANVRTGQRVRDYHPGVVAQVAPTTNGPRSNSRIQIYQDETPGGEMKGASILDHVPIEDTVHKENTIKPGPWSNGSRKCPLISSSIKPAFKVHEDLPGENYDLEHVRLFPNHVANFDGRNYPEHAGVPVFVPETAGPNVILKHHYPKDLVYANNMDRSIEEIRAELYIARFATLCEENNRREEEGRHETNGEIRQQLCDAELQEVERREKRKFEQEEMVQQQLQQQRQMEEHQQRQIEHEQQEQQRQLEHQQRQQMEQQRRQAEQYEMQQQRLHAERQLLQRQRFEADSLKLEKERREAEQRELERRRNEQLELERRRNEQLELERRRNEQLELERRRNEQLELERRRNEQLELERQRYEAKQQMKAMEASRIEAERIEAERIEAQRMEAELQNSHRKHHNSSSSASASFLLHRHHTSAGPTESEEHLLGQSLTVNTKEAMSVVQDLWHSPAVPGPHAIINRPMSHRVPDSRAKLSFDIHMDSSMTQQHAMSAAKPADLHSGNASYHLQSYQDQENPHQHYHNSYSNHESYPSHPITPHDPYQYQLPPQHQNHSLHHHMQQQQHHHHHHQQQQQQQHQQHQLADRVQPQHQQHQGHVLSPHQQHPLMQHAPPHTQSPQSQQHIHASQAHHQLAHHHTPQTQNNALHHHTPQPQNNALHHHHHHHQNHHQQQQQQQQLHHHHHQQQQQQQQHQHQQIIPQSPLAQPILHHHSPHLQAHLSRHPQPPHESPHPQHLQASHVHQQHIYGSPAAATMPNANLAAYHHQPYSMPVQCSPSQPHPVENDKALHFSPYVEPDAEPAKPYRMPDQLPYIKSPGMNRRDLKYLENADNKENSRAPVEYNEPPVEPSVDKEPENNLYVDETLGTAPLLGAENETCFTEAFATPLISSTPLTNQFRQSYRTKEVPPQYPTPNLMPQQQGTSDLTNGETGKLSIIMESTREYVSSSSGSSAHTKTTGLVFTSPPEELFPIKEQETSQESQSSSNWLATNQVYEEKMRAKIQAVHAQSPRTVQRNVDQITSEIKNNCDLRIPFKLKSVPSDEPKEADSMECDNQEAMEEAPEEPEFQLPEGDINPFDRSLIAGLLRKMKFPQPHHSEGYIKLNTNLNNKIVPSSMITLGTEAYDMEIRLGKGTYGTVMKATDIQTRQSVAMKTQKPAWIWEFYIAREIKTRLSNPHMLRGFMDITKAYVTDNASVLVSQCSKYGTLLAVTNEVKIATGKPLTESLAIFFTIEMLHIVEYLHKCQIIHGDIKPDNFLLMHLPTDDVRPTIQLIDFGCSIDMKLLPEGTTFRQVVKTPDFTCIEMQTGRPWTYQTDLYCLAGSSHCLLFGNYMKVSNNNGRWTINSKLPRYAKKAAWEMFFNELLNIESCDAMPDLSKIRNAMEEALAETSELPNKSRHFANILNKR